MANFNSDLNNLFKNYQQQQQYNQKAFDANGDGYINSNDKTFLTNKEKEIKKRENLFDVNGDGYFNQADVDMFVKGNVNGDNSITQDELNFVSKYKDDLLKAMNKEKSTFVIDGITYFNGKIASGLVNDLYYKNGVLYTGKVSSKTYVYGNLIDKDSTYTIASDKTATVTSKDGKTVIKYNSDGTEKYEVFDNNGTSLPSIVNDKIKFANSKQIEIPKGARLYIGQDGSVGVFTNNEKQRVCYDKNGNVLCTTINNNPKGEPSMQYNGWVKFEGDANARLGFSKGETIVINEDKTVTVTSKDGKTVTYYDKTGKITTKPEPISSPKPTVTIPSPVRTYDYSTPGIVDCILNTSLARNGKSKSLSIDNEGNLINKYEGASYTYKFVPGPENIDPKSIISVAWNEGDWGHLLYQQKPKNK